MSYIHARMVAWYGWRQKETLYRKSFPVAGCFRKCFVVVVVVSLLWATVYCLYFGLHRGEQQKLTENRKNNALSRKQKTKIMLQSCVLAIMLLLGSLYPITTPRSTPSPKSKVILAYQAKAVIISFSCMFVTYHMSLMLLER